MWLCGIQEPVSSPFPRFSGPALGPQMPPKRQVPESITLKRLLIPRQMTRCAEPLGQTWQDVNNKRQPCCQGRRRKANWRGRQRWKWWRCKPRKSKDCQRPPEPARDNERFVHRTFGGSAVLPTPQLPTSGLQNWERINFCVFYVCGNLQGSSKKLIHSPLHLFKQRCGAQTVMAWERELRSLNIHEAAREGSSVPSKAFALLWGEHRLCPPPLASLTASLSTCCSPHSFPWEELAAHWLCQALLWGTWDEPVEGRRRCNPCLPGVRSGAEEAGIYWKQVIEEQNKSQSFVCFFKNIFFKLQLKFSIISVSGVQHSG